MKEVAEVAAIPLLSTTIISSLGVIVTKKFLTGQNKYLGIVPGVALGFLAYFKMRKTTDQSQDPSAMESDEEDVGSR
jgi:hypothetical protein